MSISKYTYLKEWFEPKNVKKPENLKPNYLEIEICE